MERINDHQQELYAEWAESGSKNQAERYVKFLNGGGVLQRKN